MTIGRLRRKVVAGVVLAAAAIGAMAACSAADGDASNTAVLDSAASGDEGALSELAFDVRRDPGCGCCTSWVEYLKRHGATVELSDDPERAEFRTDRGISDQAASCHTAVVDGYTIEGHVAVGAIKRLLSERPDAIGLALPGMPMEAPGMGGNSESWESQPVLLVASDGSLSAYEY